MPSIDLVYYTKALILMFFTVYSCLQGSYCYKYVIFKLTWLGLWDLVGVIFLIMNNEPDNVPVFWLYQSVCE